MRANNYCVVSESHGSSFYVDQLLIQLIVFQCILKGQAEGDAEGENDQQARSSQREQGHPEMDQEAEEDQVITGRGEQTDQESANSEAAADLPPLKTDSIL